MQIKNYTNKPITEFNSEDTLYMQKILSGFMYTFLIKFKSFNKNIVTGEILDIQPNNFKSVAITLKKFRSSIKRSPLMALMDESLDTCLRYLKISSSIRTIFPPCIITSIASPKS